MYINYEIPTWTINGTNKVFTTLNTLDQSQPLNLWFDWAIYTNFTIVGNVITLVDAPEYSVFVSYATWTTNTTTTGQDTLWDIMTEVWDLLGQTSNSTTFSRDKVAKKVNAKIQEVLRGRITSLLDSNRIYRCGKIDIMEGKSGYRIQGTTKLTANFNIWDTTATCSTSTLYPAWYVQIWADIIKYTWVTTTSLQWVSWQTINHLETESIVQMYEMPTDCEKINTVMKIYSQNWLKELEIPYDPTETYQFYYNIYKVGDKTLIKVWWMNYLDQIQVSYTKKYFNMDIKFQ